MQLNECLTIVRKLGSEMRNGFEILGWNRHAQGHVATSSAASFLLLRPLPCFTVSRRFSERVPHFRLVSRQFCRLPSMCRAS
jgi:hypothetical protein